MKYKTPTLYEIGCERLSLYSELTGKEKDLLRLTDEIGAIRNKLQHNFIKEERLKHAAGLTS